MIKEIKMAIRESLPIVLLMREEGKVVEHKVRPYRIEADHLAGFSFKANQEHKFNLRNLVGVCHWFGISRDK